MKIAAARAHAQKLGKTEKALDRAWTGLMTLGGVFSIPFAVMAAVHFQTVEHGPGPLAFWAVEGAALGAMGLLRSVIKARTTHRMSAIQKIDREVLRRCETLSEVRAAVAAPMERSLAAYLSISQAAEDPLWASFGKPMEESVNAAAGRLIELLDWGERLDRAERTFPNAAADAEFTMQYRRQLAQLEAAAATFEALQAKMARSYLALSGARAGSSTSTHIIGELGASFDALTEVMDQPEAPPLRLVGRADDAPAVQQVGRAG